MDNLPSTKYHLFHKDGEFFSTVFDFHKAHEWLKNGGRVVFMTRCFSSELLGTLMDKNNG